LATNDFKVFAGSSGANVITQAQYLALAAQATGFQTGIAQSNQVNKAIRQPSIIASMIAQFICDQTGQNALDDGTIGTLETAFIAAIQAVGRIKLSSPLSLFVSPTGNDLNNTGLTLASPFQTIQKAVNVAVNAYDTQLQPITINLAGGTYANAVNVPAPLFGGGPLVISGNSASPTTVVISTNNAHAIHCGAGGNLFLGGISVQTTGSSGGVPSIGLLADTNANINIIGAMNFGACAGNHIWAGSGGNVNITASYSITGGAQAHYFATSSGTILGPPSGITVTLSGTPTFSVAFAEATQAGIVQVTSAGTTFSGAATGKRFSAFLAGQINTGGAGGSGGINFFPGSVAGTVDASTFGIFS
jgi:hypothetical protein